MKFFNPASSNSPSLKTGSKNERFCGGFWRNFQFQKSLEHALQVLNIVAVGSVYRLCLFSNFQILFTLSIYLYNRFVVLSLLTDLRKHFSRPFAWKLFPFYLSFGSLGIALRHNFPSFSHPLLTHFPFSSHLSAVDLVLTLNIFNPKMLTGR